MIWLNGAILPSPDLAINATDRGFTLGDGLFETICIAKGEPRLFDRHMARLGNGGAVLRIKTPPVPVIRQAIADLLQAAALEDAVIRLTVTRGVAARGLLPDPHTTPTVLLSVHAMSPPLGPAHVIIARTTRRNEASPLSRIKSLNALDNILARLEAQREGADDAVLLNTKGAIAEATVANLFVRIEGAVVTPPISDGALPGVMRGLLIERGLAVERQLTPALLGEADAGFLSNSLGLRPIHRLADRELPIEGQGLVDTLRRVLTA